MIELNSDTFDSLSPEKRDKTLFDGLNALEKKCDEHFTSINFKLDTLLSSPWRMAMPSVKWIVGGAIVIAALWSGKAELKDILSILGGLG